MDILLLLAGSNSSPQVSIESISPTTIFTNGSNVAIKWNSNQSGNYLFKLNGTNCEEGTTATGSNVSGNCNSKESVSSSINNSSFKLGTNSIIVCVTNSGNQKGASASSSISKSVPPVCGNGVIETGETCDDGNVIGNDGCTNTCQTQSGYNCNGSPSVCSDINECSSSSLNNCDVNATCSNVPGSFSCACNIGYCGSGTSCAPCP